LGSLDLSSRLERWRGAPTHHPLGSTTPGGGSAKICDLGWIVALFVALFVHILLDPSVSAACRFPPSPPTDHFYKFDNVI